MHRLGVRKTQPLGTPRVAKTALTQGLIGLLWTGSGRPCDLISRNRNWPVVATVRKATANGVAAECDANAHGIVSQRTQADAGTPAGVPLGWRPTALPITLMAYAAITASPPVTDSIFGTAGGAGYAVLDYAGFHQLSWSVTVGGVTNAAYSSATYSYGPVVHGFTINPAVLIGWSNGVAYPGVGSPPGTGALSYEANYNRVVYLVSNESSTTGHRGYGYWMALWNRSLSTAECKFLNANPWALFAPDVPDGYEVNAAGVLVPTLSSPSAFNITSSTVTPRVTVTF